MRKFTCIIFIIIIVFVTGCSKIAYETYSEVGFTVEDFYSTTTDEDYAIYTYPPDDYKNSYFC